MSSIYIHIPFCKSRCAYCDFITTAGKQNLLEPYLEALHAEISSSAKRFNGAGFPVDTVFFGGGTPSLLSGSQVGELLKTLREHFEVDAAAEISLEANPGTTSPKKLEDYLSAGVNRLSFGAQSMLDRELKALSRVHDRAAIEKELWSAHSAGFENLSVDLIYGLPDQTMESWQQSLNEVNQLPIKHLSPYSLILEEETPLFHQVKLGQISLPEEDLVADMYLEAQNRLAGLGWRHYEISNWAAAPEYECRHNKTYWLNGEWLGFGAGAHSHYMQRRFSNTGSVKAYIAMIAKPTKGEDNQLLSSAETWSEQNNLETEMDETMLLGFRLVEEGVDLLAFEQRFGVSPENRYLRTLTRLMKRGLIEKAMQKGKPVLRLKREALGVANQVFQEFV